MAELTTDELIALVRQAPEMTPAQKRAQKLSFIRGMTGYSTETILKVLPELGEEAHAPTE